MVLLDRLRQNDKYYTELVFYESDFVRTDNFLDLVTAILLNTYVHTVRFHECANPAWTSKQVKLLFSAIARLQTLQFVSIARTTVTLQSLAVIVEKSPQLQELDVWESKLVASEDDVQLFANALHTSHLKALYLKRVTFGGNCSLDPFFSACQESLPIFKLDQVFWAEGAVSDDAFRIRKETKLAELSIENVSLHDGQLCSIAEGLQHNNSLKTFTLRNIVISDKAAGALACCLAVNTTLRRLCLNKCSLSDAAATSLAKMLLANSTLTTLELANNDIGDQGAIDLADALLHSWVQQLEIQGNPRIGTAGIEALLQLAEESETLESMKLFTMSRQSSTLEQLDIQRKVDSYMNLNARIQYPARTSGKRRKVWYE